MSIKQNNQQEKAPVKTKVQDKVAVPAQPSLIQAKVNGAVAYFENAQKELTKVSWPTWKEVKVTGFAVAALVLVMSFFLGTVDVFLSWVVKSILSIGL